MDDLIAYLDIIGHRADEKDDNDATISSDDLS